MIIDNKFLTEAVLSFKKAHSNFYSPVGRSELLTQEEIELRTYYCIHSAIKISKKEIVYRRFWEIIMLPQKDWEKAFKIALKFLEGNNIDNGKVLSIINELVGEIEFLEKNKGRVVHNPHN